MDPRHRDVRWAVRPRVHAALVIVPMFGQGFIGSRSVGMYPRFGFDRIAETKRSKYLSQSSGIRRNLIRPKPFGSCTSTAMATKLLAVWLLSFAPLSNLFESRIPT